MRKFLFAGLCLAIVLTSVRAQAPSPPQPEPTQEGKTLTQWLDALADKDQAKRGKAAQVVATMGWKAPQKPTNVALGMLNDDKNTYNRLLGAYILSHIRPEAGIVAAPLCKAIKDKDSSVSRQAAEALAKLGAGADSQTSALLDMLKQPWPKGNRAKNQEISTRFFAAYVLGAINPEPKTVAPVLVQVYADKETPEPVKRAAGDALKRIDPVAAKKAGIP